MKVLVTNTRAAQAYGIIHALRPHAEKIVATRSGNNWRAAYTCHAAYSRLVDRRYLVPHPSKDWYDGQVQRENTESEEAYVQALLDICEKEDIDTVFPSIDPVVYVLSKNIERFKERGVVIPLPDLDITNKFLDKYKAIELAAEVGFPHPKTLLVESEADIERAATLCEPPWIVRPLNTVGSQGMEFVLDRAVLEEKIRKVMQFSGGKLMVQEYIPGNEKDNAYVVIDKEGNTCAYQCPKIVRYSRRIFRAGGTVARTDYENRYRQPITDMLARAGWWGPATVQYKIDPRDNEPKLMEINARIGSHLWYRTELGINIPMMTLAIARGEQVDFEQEEPEEQLLIEPIEDFFNLGHELADLLAYRVRVTLLRKQSLDPLAPPQTLKQLAANCREAYFTKTKKKYSPHFVYALRDPHATLIWLYTLLRSYLRTGPQLGR